MTLCKVNDVDVITYTRAVRCIIVVTEDVNDLALARCNLSYIRKKVVRNTLRIFTDETADVSTDRVEVAE